MPIIKICSPHSAKRCAKQRNLFPKKAGWFMGVQITQFHHFLLFAEGTFWGTSTKGQPCGSRSAQRAALCMAQRAALCMAQCAALCMTQCAALCMAQRAALCMAQRAALCMA
eukprot:gene8974-biopygen22679